jgi:hypothetical protein
MSVATEDLSGILDGEPTKVVIKINQMFYRSNQTYKIKKTASKNDSAIITSTFRMM